MGKIGKLKLKLDKPYVRRVSPKRVAAPTLAAVLQRKVLKVAAAVEAALHRGLATGGAHLRQSKKEFAAWVQR